MEPFRLFIPYEKSISEKLRMIARKIGFTAVFTKSRDLRSQFRFKNKEPKDVSGEVYEIKCSNCKKI